MAKGRGIALLGGIAIGAAAILLMDQDKKNKIRKELKSLYDNQIHPTIKKVEDYVENAINDDH